MSYPGPSEDFEPSHSAANKLYHYLLQDGRSKGRNIRDRISVTSKAPWTAKMLLLCISLLLLGAFVDGEQCPLVNQALCTCVGTTMDCNSRDLISLPVFTTDSTITELHLEGNRIDNITSDAFKSFQVLSTLNLRNNTISRVDNDSFAGIEPSLLKLDLSLNWLTELPAAVGELNSLQTLDVSGNPINASRFSDHVMYSIGDTLNKFTFGSQDVTVWPATVRHLQALEYLKVIGGQYYTLPPDAFHGFEGTLRELTMQHTNLIALPLAISNLRWLDTLHFDHNHLLGDSGVLIPSFGDRELLPKLHTISLIDDNLHVFPSLLRYLHAVRKLILDSNRLAFVSDASVQVAIGTNIVDLSLQNCSLSRVPGALSKLTNLTNLNLASNNIYSFENKDFEGMVHLGNLTILNNPLEYIANETFKDLRQLEHLNLMNTRIKSMPEAVRFLPNLKDLKFPENSIECTCGIAWLKEFIDNCDADLVIVGSCETIISTIAEYLVNHIPNCPNYKSTTTCV